MPLQAAFYQTDRNWQRKLHITNAFCCGNLATIDGKIANQDLKFNRTTHTIQTDPRILHIAMCHVGASVSTWNHLFAMNVSDQWDVTRLEQHVQNVMIQVDFPCSATPVFELSSFYDE
jgi:hypothetical protein